MGRAFVYTLYWCGRVAVVVAPDPAAVGGHVAECADEHFFKKRKEKERNGRGEQKKTRTGDVALLSLPYYYVYLQNVFDRAAPRLSETETEINQFRTK